jgi:hypothetical protein
VQTYFPQISENTLNSFKSHYPTSYLQILRFLRETFVPQDFLKRNIAQDIFPADFGECAEFFKKLLSYFMSANSAFSAGNFCSTRFFEKKHRARHISRRFRGMRGILSKVINPSSYLRILRFLRETFVPQDFLKET